MATPLKLKVNTSKAGSASNTFVLPLNNTFSASYDFTINWGDSITSAVTDATVGFPLITHVYSTSGIYTLEISANSTSGFPTIYFNFTGDKLKLMELSQWGDSVTWLSMDSSFQGCNNLQITATDEAIAKTGNISDFDGAWAYCTSLSSFPLLNTSAGTNFEVAWINCNSLTSFPLIDTSNGTSFYTTWKNCTSLSSFPLLNTSAVTNFERAWDNCTSLSSFPLIDTSNGTNFRFSWLDCYSLSSFPLIDTSNGIDFSYAWYNCNSLSSFPLIDTSNGTWFFLTWRNCYSLTSFPLLNTSAVTNFGGAWYNCNSLSSFPLIDTSNGTSFFTTWYNCNSLTSFPLIDTSNGTSFNNTWSGCTLDTSAWNSILINLNDYNPTSGTLLGGGYSKYDSSATTARASLVSKNWIITDGGLDANVYVDLSASTSGYGYSYSPINSNQLTSAYTNFSVGDTFKLKGVKDYTSGVSLNLPNSATIDAWDLSVHGPWRLGIMRGMNQGVYGKEVFFRNGILYLHGDATTSITSNTYIDDNFQTSSFDSWWDSDFLYNNHIENYGGNIVAVKGYEGFDKLTPSNISGDFTLDTQIVWGADQIGNASIHLSIYDTSDALQCEVLWDNEAFLWKWDEGTLQDFETVPSSAYGSFWMRMVRVGSTITAYCSKNDRVSWITLVNPFTFSGDFYLVINGADKNAFGEFDFEADAGFPYSSNMNNNEFCMNIGSLENVFFRFSATSGAILGNGKYPITIKGSTLIIPSATYWDTSLATGTSIIAIDSIFDMTNFCGQSATLTTTSANFNNVVFISSACGDSPGCIQGNLIATWSVSAIQYNWIPPVWPNLLSGTQSNFSYVALTSGTHDITISGTGTWT